MTRSSDAEIGRVATLSAVTGAPSASKRTVAGPLKRGVMVVMNGNVLLVMGRNPVNDFACVRANRLLEIITGGETYRIATDAEIDQFERKASE